jgi:large repetitive protein
VLSPARRSITSIFRRLFRKFSPRTPITGTKGRKRPFSRLLMEALEDRLAPTATPQVSLSFPQPTPFIDSPASFTATFDNSGSTVGYGPYIDLFLPTTGEHAPNASANYGISFVSATYLGQAVTSNVYTLTAAGVAHPYAVDNTGAPLIIKPPPGFEPGDELVVLQLPFGSFTSGQPAVNLQINTAVGPWATVNAAQMIQADSGFQYGNDPLNDPTTDPTILGPTTNGNVTPSLFTVNTVYNGPEDETATGPNFPESYTVNVSVAPGQTLTNLDVTDSLPNNLAYLGVTSASPANSILSQPPVGVPQNAPNNLTLQFPSITGTGGNDANFTFQFYIPQNDANGSLVLNPSTGAFVPSPSSVQGQANWTPLAPGSSSTTVTSPVETVTPLIDKSIAVQKSVSVIDTAGTPGYTTPGDTLQYTVQFEVSDFFALENVLLNDTISDGQLLNNSFTPTLTLSQHGSSTSGAVNSSNYTYTLNSDGTSTLLLNISNELQDRSFLGNGLLVGGQIPFGSGNGPTIGTITYQTVIQTDYRVYDPSGDPKIDQGDVVGNHVWVSGAVVNTSNLTTPTGSSVEDDSSTQTVISQGSLLKSIYAINGVVGTYTTPQVTPGDTVTYRLTLQLATSNVEDLTLSDFLPLPVYDATTVTNFQPTVYASGAPVAGSAGYGPSDTFHNLTGAPTPTMSTNGTANSVVFDYGTTGNSVPNESSTIDLLFSVQVGGEPFTDGLFLTNMAQAQASNTATVITFQQQALQQSVLTEPDLSITKGVVATNDPAGSYSQAVGPTTFSAPGSSSVRFSGTLNSNNLTATPVNANLSGIQAGDLVTFADVVQNTGTGLDGAFNVELKDAIPQGFAIPSGGAGLNLEVTDGNGNVLAYTNLGGGLFDPNGGIELTDPNPATPGTGALAPYSPTNGKNVLVVTYDLVATPAVEPNQLSDSTATVTNYASVENGPNFVPNGISDDASVQIADTTVAKSIISTTQPFTSGSNLTVGEEATYQVVVTVPQGTSDNVLLTDTLDKGLAFVSVNSLSESSALSTDATGGFAGVLSGATIGNVGAGQENEGRQLTFNFGDITNTDTNDATAETITLTYTVVAIDGSTVDRGATLQNDAIWTWADGSATGRAPVHIVEPKLAVTVTPSPNTGQSGTTVTYTVTVTNTNNAQGTDAFNAALLDTVPAGVNYVNGSLSYVSGVVPGTLTITAGQIAADWSTLALGQTSTFQFQGIVNQSVMPNQQIVDTANVQWTSLPSPQGTSPESTFNPLSVQRTGNTTDPGGAQNTYDASGSGTVTVFNVAPVKSIVATSEAFTGVVGGVQQATIGEIVRYQLLVQLPNSTMNGFEMIDSLPTGLSFLDPSNAMILFTSDTAMTLPSNLLGAQGSGTTPTFVVPASDITVSGQQVTFDLGDIVNNDTDSTPAYATLDFNAIVLNSAANTPGAVETNSFAVDINGSNLASNTVNLKIVEPNLTNNLSVSPGGADVGDTMTYTITVTNNGTSPAFDTNLLDNLPNTVTLIGNVTTTFGGGAAGLHNNTVGNQINLGIDTIPVNGTVTVTFQATVNSQTGQTIPNPGDIIPDSDTLTTTTLPGTGTSPNPTGTNTPGASGAANGERNGSGGVNNLSSTSNASFSIYSNSIGGTVYRDNNNNGVYEPGLGETGVGGVTVTLSGTNQLNQAVNLTTTTAANGSYQFTGLRPGTYTVTKAPAAGLLDGIDTAGTPFGGSNATTDVLSSLVIPHGSNPSGTGYNFGELVPSTFSGFVYLDNNDNGVFEPGLGETGVGGVTIALTGRNDLGNPVSLTAVTLANGSYQFTNLRPSNANGYTITETPPANLLSGKDTPGSGAVQVTGVGQFKTVLPSNTTDANNNIGELVPSSLSGSVYRQNDSIGISGITITLTGTDDLNHAVSDTVTTNANGIYSFTQLRPGSYTITETPPAGFTQGATSVGSQGGIANGTVITIAPLGTNTTGVNNNFVEISPLPAVNAGPDVSFCMCMCGSQSLYQTVTFADPIQNATWTATVDYGDGSPLQIINLGTTQTFVLQHVYTANGVYQVNVTVADSYGDSGSSSFLVTQDAIPLTAHSQFLTINDGSAQDSMVNSITLSFGQIINSFDPGAFSLVNTVSGASVGVRTIAKNIGSQTVVMLQFTGSGIVGGSLANGTYKLTIAAAKVHTQSGAAWNGGANYTSATITRLFGDVNGDGLVNGVDLLAFSNALRSTDGSARYVWYLDYDQNCVIDTNDYSQFLKDYRP